MSTISNANSSALYGSYAQRFPQGVFKGIEISKSFFAADKVLPITKFVEPAAAADLRKALWEATIDATAQKCPELQRVTIDGLSALVDADGNKKSFAGPLYTLDDPTSPTTFYDTNWSYLAATAEPKYIEILESENILPPLMAGFHLDSPRVPCERRPSSNLGRAGEVHPPSCGMRKPSLRESPASYLFIKTPTQDRLGLLGVKNFDQALAQCEKIMLGQIHTYNPDQKAQNAYLADYRFIFEGGIQLPLPTP